MLSKELLALALEINKKCLESGKIISTAESCTGGLLAAYITAISGSSHYFEYGFITYSYKAKSDLLKVSPTILSKYGAVSEETAQEMAYLSRIKADSDISISISGIAGPGGGTTEKPVGLVCFGISTKSTTETYSFHYIGNRDEIREQSCKKALELILSKI